VSRRDFGNFTALAVYNGLARNRLGITATKKTGDAVERNRLKREAREYFRLRSPFWPQGLDVIFIAHRDIGWEKRRRTLLSLAEGPEERSFFGFLRHAHGLGFRADLLPTARAVNRKIKDGKLKLKRQTEKEKAARGESLPPRP
jgi:ribonuclease P protein component